MGWAVDPSGTRDRPQFLPKANTYLPPHCSYRHQESVPLCLPLFQVIIMYKSLADYPLHTHTHFLSSPQFTLEGAHILV